jgi:hypothetical protein
MMTKIGTTYLELTEQKAKDLNAICQFALNKGINENFAISYYQRETQTHNIEYLRHLLDIAKQFYNINKAIDLSDGYNVRATHNTKEFLESGGFLRIYNQEKEVSEVRELNRQQLQSVIDTNKSVRRTNRTIIGTSVITVLIVTATMIISYWQLVKSEDIRVTLNQEQYKSMLRWQDSILQLQTSLKRDSLLKDTASHR